MSEDLTKNFENWILTNLTPSPFEEWDKLLEFVNFQTHEKEAMLKTVEPLFRRGHELVVNNYDYLMQNRETAVILGWDQGVDPDHLAERRRFFTTWLARTIGMDFSHDFANYLFRAGQKHAGHGEREIFIPDVYVIGAISLVMQSFAHFLQDEMACSPEIPIAIGAWNKYLNLHLHLMLEGAQTARALDKGDFSIETRLFGKLRSLINRKDIQIHLHYQSRVEIALRKLFNYYPQIREDVFDIIWIEGEREDTLGRSWMVMEKAYRIKPGWRVLINGRIIDYNGGLSIILEEGDQLQLFPPGR